MAALTPVINEIGYKMNYTDLQACIGRVQLARMSAMSQRRSEIAAYYSRKIGELDLPCAIQHGVCEAGHARHLYVVALQLERLRIGRNDLLLKLRDRNIGASIHYSPLHTMPVYRRDGDLELPETDWLYNRIMTLPIGAAMTLDDAADVISALSDLCKEFGK